MRLGGLFLVGALLGGCGGASADAAGPIGDPPEEVTLTMAPFVIEPGGEAFMCQNFANPFGGVDVYIREFESHMTGGSHHLQVNYFGGPRSNGVAPCSGLEFPTGPYAAQTSDYVHTYQDGVAAPLLGWQGLRLNSHYLNTSLEPLTARVSVTLRRTPPEAVVKEARTGMSLYTQINIPPRETKTVTSGVKFGEEAELLWIMPHMHMRGTHFVAKATDGRTTNVIFETEDWEAPPHKFDPPILMPATWNLDYSCTFVNTTETTLTFGESALNNEMCVLIYQHTADKPHQ